MEHYPTRWSPSEYETEELGTHEQAIRFMLDVINATIYGSGEDYDQALQDFFAQLEALGHLIGARELDEISAFLRRRCRPY